MNIHEKYIKRCIQLAQNGLGTTYPNPLVGSVIVHNNTIIGEGWHKKAGEPHAEVNAIQSVKDTSLLKNATIYVSLEPCSHFGKTPPCCDLIIKNKIPNVVIGTVDPNIKVAGNGIKKLLEAGINVTVGVLEQDCLELNKRFFTFHEKKRPFIILKWAESVDGFIAPVDRFEQKPVWITNSYSRQLVHKWRTEEQAILVGTQTVIDDNPKLNARDWYGKNPVRLVLDQKNRIPKESAIFNNQAQTIIYTNILSTRNLENCVEKIIDFTKNIVPQIIQTLYEMDVQSVIIEGGQHTLNSFIETNLWDEARIFIGDKPLHYGVKAPQISKSIVQKKYIVTDKLLLVKNHD